jgi:hypothetical protein
MEPSTGWSIAIARVLLFFRDTRQEREPFVLRPLDAFASLGRVTGLLRNDSVRVGSEFKRTLTDSIRVTTPGA